jgi:Protein of unknown function DUF58
MPFFRRLRYYASFFPLRLNLFLWMVLLTGLYWKFGTGNNNLNDLGDIISQLLLKMVLIITIFVLGGGLITVLIPWMHFIFSKKNREPVFKYQFEQSSNGENGFIHINISINSLWRPLLGTVQMQWWYADGTSSGKMILAGNRRRHNSLLRESVKGHYRLMLPAIRSYSIREAAVYFEDGIRLFSLAGGLSLEAGFYVGARHSPLKERAITPRKTEEAKLHIQSIRKTEGDYLHYKDFESNDDVRRIVWKIYARNKDLVVRIPEMHNPYASHVSVYASFYSAGFAEAGTAVGQMWLNHYKNAIWSLLHQMQQQDLAIRLKADQENNNVQQVKPEEQLHFQVSVAEWQHYLPVQKYFQPADAAILFFTSLVPSSDLAIAIRNTSPDTLLVFVPLSRLMVIKTGEWWKYIFMKPSAGSLESAKWSWVKSGDRKAVLKNEAEIEKLLHQIQSKLLVL